MTTMTCAPPFVCDWASLTKEVRVRGWDRPQTGRFLAELGIHVGIAGVGACLYFASRGLLPTLLGLALFTLGSFGISTNVHTASHRAATEYGALDQVLALFGYPFALGMAATYWHHKHVRAHHRAPNTLGIDGDVDLRPLFAITEPHVRSAGGFARRWYAVQWVVLPLAIALIAVGMAVRSWRYLGRQLLNTRRRRPIHWLDLAALAAQALTWCALVWLGLPVQRVLALLVLRILLLGYFFFCAFAPAHFPEDAVCVTPGGFRARGYVDAVTSTTINLRLGGVASFFFSGIDYQIEHHLFPRVSHVHYGELSKLVAQYCAYHGHRYRAVGLAEGVRGSLRVFRRPKKVQRANV